MNRSFICELVPTLTGPSNKPKETVSFYIEHGEKRFSIYGVSSSGVLKEGELNRLKDEDSVLVGGFVEDGAEILVSFSLALFDTDFVMGSGIWTESNAEGSVRQKYNAKVWDLQLSKIESRFAVGAIERLKELQESLEDIGEHERDLSKNYSSLEEKVEEALDSASEFIDSKDELDSVLANFHESESEYEKIVIKMEDGYKHFEAEQVRLADQNDKAQQLLEDFDKIKVRSSETQEKADKALSSSITVQLARSFKMRKDDAVASRVACDRWFGAAIAVAILISVSFVLLATFFGTGSASYFEYMLSRVPVLVFPVWFAVFFAKKSSAASRLEEFYAHKQALAESYEGYSQEIRKISDDSPDEELSALMAINLVSIGKDSASIWDDALKEKHSLLDSVLGDKLELLMRKQKLRSSLAGEQEKGL